MIDFILHIDQYMVSMVHTYHHWTYFILFLIIFCETGLVVTPFLPGDSLLFVAGAIAALPGHALNVHVLVLLLFAAAVLGDSCNYAIGRYFGTWLSGIRIRGFSGSLIWKRRMIFIVNTEARLSSWHVLCRWCALLLPVWPEWDVCTTTILCYIIWQEQPYGYCCSVMPDIFSAICRLCSRI